MQKVTIHTDGSCLGNPGPGGWAAILKLDDEDYRKEFSGGYALTTNNRMEMLAVIEALLLLKNPCLVDLYTDSRYVCDSVSKGWLWGWVKKNWIKSDKKPVLNVDMWQRMLPLLKQHNRSVENFLFYILVFGCRHTAIAFFFRYYEFFCSR